MSLWRRMLLPLAAGLLGALFITTIYFGLVSWAESPQHAWELFWQERWLVVPIILGFGIQVSLYTILKKRLFAPAVSSAPSGVITGAGGATSTVAMVACCAHHVTDVLPILGMTAAATFLASYQTTFMLVGLSVTWIGIAIMTTILFKERQKAIQQLTLIQQTS
ncbi:MAG: hypothetical protein ACNA8H_10090 [Anaerolineales bacterium]